MTVGALVCFHVAGFRSLRDVAIEPTPLTVLIGPNGAGKSNLLWALEMVRMMASNPSSSSSPNAAVPHA